MSTIAGKTFLVFLKQATESIRTFRSVLDALSEDTKKELGPLFIAADQQTTSMLGAIQRMQALLMGRERQL